MSGRTTVALTDTAQTTAADANHPTEAIYAHDDLHALQDPLHMGAMPAKSIPESPRHRQEKAHLIKRMDRKHGKWGSSHPRYRLLEALFSFNKYKERNLAELDRWRGLYKNVGKSQKKVRLKTDGALLASVDFSSRH